MNDLRKTETSVTEIIRLLNDSALPNLNTVNNTRDLKKIMQKGKINHLLDLIEDDPKITGVEKQNYLSILS